MIPLKLLSPKLWQQQAGVLFWCLRKVPMLFWMTPLVKKLTESECHLYVPLTWRTRNHLQSMYFGALLSAADLVCGLVALAALEKKGVRARLLFSKVQGQFLRRPESGVDFHCKISSEALSKLDALQGVGDKAFIVLKVDALCEGVKVSEFELEVALKRL